MSVAVREDTHRGMGGAGKPVMGLVKTTSGKLLVVLKESAGEVIRQLENGLFKVKLMSQEGVRYVIDNLTLVEMQPLLAATGNGFANLRGQLARIDLGDYGIRAAMRELTGISDELLEALLQRGLSESQLARLADNLVFGKNPQLFKHLLESTEGLTKKELEAFANDLLTKPANSNGNELLERFTKLPFNIKTWKLLRKRREMVFDNDILEAVELLGKNHPDLDEELFDKIMKSLGKAGVKCKTCPTDNKIAAHLKPAHEIVGDIDWFLRQYKELPDIKKVLAEMGETDRKATGGAFILRVLRDAPENIKGNISKFEAKIDEIAGDFRYDILTEEGLVTRFYEFKSWGSVFSFKTDQFAAYLAKIQSLSDLNYLFQKRDAIVDVTSIKDKIMNQLRKDKAILENLIQNGKLQLLIPFPPINSVDDFLIEFEKSINFEKVFKVVENEL